MRFHHDLVLPDHPELLARHALDIVGVVLQPVDLNAEREILLGEVLVEAERRAQESSPKTATELAPLFQEWIDLLFKYKRLRQLRRLSRKL